MTDKILTETRGHVLIVTVNRPEARNAFDRETAQGMEAAMDRLEGEDDLFAAVITGGGGTFSSGADLKGVARGERPHSLKRGGFGMFRRPPGKPVVAAVEGYAVAGGFELCLSCDLIVAAEDAKMGLPEVRHNLVAIGGGLFRLPKRMPYHLAMELALTAEMKPAPWFHEKGVVNRIAPPGGALDEAMALLDKVLVNGPTALAATKKIVQRAYDWADTDGFERQLDIAEPALKSEDRAEGLRAFAEKRKPVWKGR